MTLTKYYLNFEVQISKMTTFNRMKMEKKTQTNIYLIFKIFY